MFAPPTWLPVVVYLSYVAAFASRFFASTTCTAPVRLLWLVVRGCLRSLPPQFQCLSINLVLVSSPPIPVAATTSIHVPAVSPSSIPVPGVLRSPVPAVMSGSLVQDSDDSRDFVVFVFSDDSFSDLSNNNNDCDGP